MTPICTYDDIITIQEIVRKLRKEGARPNASCGMHVHVGAEHHTVDSLIRLSYSMWAREDILYKALNVKDQRETYCHKTAQKYIDKLQEVKPKTFEELADCWYSISERYNESRSDHYNSSRYHALNLHAYFTKGTVEFRCFNATLHAGEVKAYIQFALGASAQAINQKRLGIKNKTSSTNECYTFRTWLIKIPLNGDEFKTCRHHMLKNLIGAKDWKDKEAAMQRRRERAEMIRQQAESMRDVQGNPLTVQQILEQPEREDVSLGITTRQQIIMLLEEMQDSSVTDEERSALRLILRLQPAEDEQAANTRTATADNSAAIRNWSQQGTATPTPPGHQNAQSSTTRRRRR